jgi:hypothetical protein
MTSVITLEGLRNTRSLPDTPAACAERRAAIGTVAVFHAAAPLGVYPA